MPVQLNHTIVPAKDAAASSRWYAEVLGLDEPVRFGPFWQISTSNGVSLDFGTDDARGEIHSLHFAFLVSEDEFDAIFGRIRRAGVPYYADPAGKQPNQINHNDGGRGVYFPDPDGHWLEAITRPYASAT